MPDSTGYLWLATDDGVRRYDGYAAVPVVVRIVLRAEVARGELAAGEPAALDMRGLAAGIYTVQIGTTMQRLVVE